MEIEYKSSEGQNYYTLEMKRIKTDRFELTKPLDRARPTQQNGTHQNEDDNQITSISGFLVTSLLAAKSFLGLQHVRLETHKPQPQKQPA